VTATDLFPRLAALMEEWSSPAEPDAPAAVPPSARPSVPAPDVFVPVARVAVTPPPAEPPPRVTLTPSPSAAPVTLPPSVGEQRRAQEHVQAMRLARARQQWHRERMARGHRRELERHGQFVRPDDERAHDVADLTWEANQYIGQPPEHLRPYWTCRNPQTPDAVRVHVPLEVLTPILERMQWP
jgi:hypothetical protein